MKTHTIRSNKSKKLRIITFTEAFMDLLKCANLNSISILIPALVTELNSMTGKRHAINLDQVDLVAEITKPQIQKVTSYSYKQHQMKEMIVRGFKFNDLVKDLELLNYAFRKIENED